MQNKFLWATALILGLNINTLPDARGADTFIYACIDSPGTNKFNTDQLCMTACDSLKPPLNYTGKVFCEEGVNYNCPDQCACQCTYPGKQIEKEKKTEETKTEE